MGTWARQGLTLRGRVSVAARAAGVVVAGLAAGARPAWGVDQPVQATIVVDGEMDDWAEVLTNPLNTSRDGEGSLVACPYSTDRDCPVPAPAVDLVRFAWTWGPDDLFAHFATSGQMVDTELHVFMDMDRDGLMQSDEPVLVIAIAAGDVGNLSRLAYRPSAPSGDPLVDAAGFADGYSMPGSATSLSPVAGRAKLSRDKASLEISVDWPSGTPPAFLYHVGAKVPSLPVFADNVGGSDGRVGTTAFRLTRLDDDVDRAVAAGGTARLPHVATNAGNVAATLALSATAASGLGITWWRDEDGDGTGDTYLGRDAGGDGSFAELGDDLAPAGDSDGDGVIDLGAIDPAASAAVVLDVVAPAAGTVEQVDVMAWQPAFAEACDAARDRIFVGEITLRAGLSLLAAAGDVAWFPHVVANMSPQPLVVDLSIGSTQGWGWTLYLDPDGDGDPSDATPLVDGDGSGLPDVTLLAGAERAVLARLTVPTWAAEWSVERATLRATASGLPEAVLADEATVVPPVQLEPDYLLADSRARYGGPGGFVYFAHRLTSACGTAQVFALDATSDAGWRTWLLSDPDGDGRPFDSEPLPGATALVPGNGGTFPFLVRVEIPAATPTGDTSRIDVLASVPADPTRFASASDDAVAAIVRVYEDAGHVVNVSATPPCRTIHALATGLRPLATPLRFAWRDAAGLTVRVTDTAASSSGACQDDMDVGAGDLGSGWSVAILEWDGRAFASLDTARFDVVDPAWVYGLEVSPAVQHVVSSTLVADVDVGSSSPDLSVPDTRLRWVVLTPDGTRFLDGSGAFLPYTGVEATRRDVVTLPPSGSVRVTLREVDVPYVVTGTHVVEVWRERDCGGALLEASATFEVVDDEDADGLSASLERAAGTDPADADSDDDGLADGADGTGDSDGDGLVDALDCDSDGDGLGDGLEAGAWTAGADTDVSRGCFRPDLSPTTTTDPDVRDTDGGGVPDGLEDADGNGRVDPAELDPRDPGDDSSLCSPLPPAAVTGVRVVRDGADVIVTWTVLADPCTSYSVSASGSPADDAMVASGLGALFRDALAADAPGARFYLVQSVSVVSGPGPLRP